MYNKVIFLIIVTAAISGCMPSLQDAIKNLPGFPSTSSYIPGGSAGVSMEIISPSEDETVSSDYPFEPKVRITNEGGADTEGSICIFGLDEEAFSGFSGCECEDYEIVVTEEGAESDREKVILFPSYSIQKFEDITNGEMTISNKYKYKTKGTFEACIKKDPFSKKGCQIKSGSRSENLVKSTTSGPLSIEKVTESINVEENTADVTFTVEAEKKGKGNLLGLDDFNVHTCERKEGLKPEFEVRLLNVPDIGSINCGTGTMDEEGKGHVSCNAEISLTDKSGSYLYENYNPTIEIEVTYTFEEIATTAFTIG